MIVKIGDPVRPLRDDHLKPRSCAGFSGLPDRDTGDVENVPGDGQPKTGVLPEPPIEYPLFLLTGHTIAIILAYDDPLPVAFLKREPDCRDPAPMPDSIVYEVEEDLDDQRIGVHFSAGQEDRS